MDGSVKKVFVGMNKKESMIANKYVLQIDHINGDGVRYKDGGFYIFRILQEIKKGSREYQLLCANCNWIKRFKEMRAS